MDLYLYQSIISVLLTVFRQQKTRQMGGFFICKSLEFVFHAYS
ncbi:hypothetical protein FIU82_12180 [Pseudoalteromonas sp. THAF3]|nr:hypothetical protein FIU82_12180 [Pseudoalteromonas sp. THAF3]